MIISPQISPIGPMAIPCCAVCLLRTEMVLPEHIDIIPESPRDCYEFADVIG